MNAAGPLHPQPFRVAVDKRVLDDLELRLHRARWPSQKATDWSSGTDTDYLRELVDYWGSKYDWRDHEARLNALEPQTVQLDGANVFFVHAPGRGPSPMPLLLLHGWPDSFYRFHKVISTLSNPASSGRELTDSFDVVVPSLPGFAFTDAIRAAERPMRHGAELLWRLMTQVLGYERFMVAGSDTGSVLAQCMAIEHPEAVIGVHVTDLGWHAMQVDRASLSKSERKYLEAGDKHARADGAYVLVQMTQPRSLAAGLNDSPVGLAAWIVDRFHSWTDFDDHLEQVVTRDELLTNIMLYWVTQTIGSSVMNYYAEARAPSLTPADRVDRPVAVALFPKDIGGVPPRSLAERTLNVQRWTELPRGGHFAALEQPELYGRELVSFSRELRGLHPLPEPETSHVVPFL